jgi:hypothetical protein
MSDDFKALLDLYASGALTAIASHHGVAPKGSKIKADIIDILARALPNPATIQKSLATLSKAERAALDAILRRDGQTSAHQIRQELLRQKLIDRESETESSPYNRPPNPRDVNSRQLEDILARLTLRGLVFSAEDPKDPRRGVPGYMAEKRDFNQQLTTVIIPEVIRRHLPPPAPLPEPARPKPIEVAHVQESSARAFQRDLYLYWSFVREHKVAVTAKGELHKRMLSDINAALLTREEIGKGTGELQLPRLRFVRGLLTALGLLRETPEREIVTIETGEFFGLSPADRVQRSYETWLGGTFFDELLMLPRDGVPIQTQVPLLPAPALIIDARRTVIDHVRQSGAERWIAFDALVERLYEFNSEFLFERPVRRSAYYYSPPHPYSGVNPIGFAALSVNTNEAGWQKVEANFIRDVALGPLFWLGLIDLGKTQSAERSPAAFRLNALGAWVMGLGPRPDIRAEGGRVIVQPNLHVVALDPVNDATLVTLDRFAKRLGAERAVEYQLTRASVYAGQQAGWDVPRIKEFLREQTGAEMPANVARTLDEWQTLHEHIIIRPRVGLVHGSASVLDEALSDPKVAQHVAARPLPEVALVRSSASIRNLTQALHARGLLPLITTQPKVAPNSIVATETGEIAFTTRAPSLYLHGHLAAFADPIDEQHYEITAETIERATRGGLTASQIVERLTSIHRDPLPEGLVRRIRAWAKYYGDAALEAVTLLQVRDDQTLNELLAEPEIAALLKPFAPGKHKALARVREKDLEALRALLSERGIDIDDKLK